MTIDSSLLTLAAQTGRMQIIWEALMLMVVGMGVVYLALLIIGEMMGLLSKLLPHQPSSEENALDSAPEARVEAPAPAAMTGGQGVDPKTIAILTAAAMAVVGKPVRVRRITFVNQNTISAWAELGRIDIQSSHNIRRSL